MVEEYDKYDPMDEPKGRVKGSFWGRGHGSRAPIASRLVRKLTGLEFELQFADGAVRRGEGVELSLTVSKRRGRARRDRRRARLRGVLRRRDDHIRDKQSQRTRTTKRATAHEQWIRLEAPVAERTVSFEVPENAPYSYDGAL